MRGPRDKSKAGQAAPEEVAKPNPEKIMMTVWKCPDCSYLNELDIADCGNSKKCKANLGFIEDLGSVIMEVSQADLRN